MSLRILSLVVLVYVAHNRAAHGPGTSMVLVMMVERSRCAVLLGHDCERGGRPDAQPADAQQPPRIVRMSENRLASTDGPLEAAGRVAGVRDVGGVGGGGGVRRRRSRQYSIVSGSDKLVVLIS